MHNANSIILPVASPPECKILLTLWAASLVKHKLLFSSLSNSTPNFNKSFTTASECSEIYFTVLNSLKPAPAFIVSEICEAVESALFSFITATIPP